MQEENRQELSKLMALYQNDQEGLRIKKEQDKLAQTKFSTDFEKLKKEIIWPTIVDVGNEIVKYGHDYHVAEEKEYVDSIASFHPAHMTFYIYLSKLPNEYRKNECAPYISFVADTYARKVDIVVSTMMPGQGGSIGSHGDYEPSQITRKFIENELVNVLKNSFIFHVGGK